MLWCPSHARSLRWVQPVVSGILHMGSTQETHTLKPSLTIPVLRSPRTPTASLFAFLLLCLCPLPAPSLLQLLLMQRPAALVTCSMPLRLPALVEHTKPSPLLHCVFYATSLPCPCYPPEFCMNSRAVTRHGRPSTEALYGRPVRNLCKHLKSEGKGLNLLLLPLLTQVIIFRIQPKHGGLNQYTVSSLDISTTKGVGQSPAFLLYQAIKLVAPQIHSKFSPRSVVFVGPVKTCAARHGETSATKQQQTSFCLPSMST